MEKLFTLLHAVFISLVIYVLILLFFLAVPDSEAMTTEEHCDSLGLYSLILFGCPNYNPEINTAIPLCDQPEHQHLSYLDHRCYKEEPFDWSAFCYDWNCPVPYDHVYVEPLSGTKKVVRGPSYELDAHYRACRQGLGQ